MSNLGFVFPGQGSQAIGMLSDFSENACVRDCFSEASQILNYDVWELIQNGSHEAIAQTQRTQPILLTCSVALFRLWRERGGRSPDFLAGHSLGEWSALVCSGVITFKAAVDIVETRGRLMQAAVPAGEGAMAAILGLDDNLIVSLCTEAEEGDEVSAVNFNAPGQVVIAGSALGVKRAIALCQQAGARRAISLPVSAPFHTKMMQPAAFKLAESLDDTVFSPPLIPIVFNVNAQLEQNEDRIRDLMLEQIYRPVRWVNCIQKLAELGVTGIVECGPGRVLSGLSKRIDRSFTLGSTDDNTTFNTTINSF